MLQLLFMSCLFAGETHEGQWQQTLCFPKQRWHIKNNAGSNLELTFVIAFQLTIQKQHCY